MVYSMILFILVSGFSWISFKYLIPHYRRLNFGLGFFSLHHFCYSYYDYWTLDIEKIQLLFTQNQMNGSRWITIHVQGVSLVYHSLPLQPIPAKSTTTATTKVSLWLTTWWNTMQSGLSLAKRYIKKASSLPIQWCLALLTGYVKLHVEGVSLKLITSKGMYYWLCIDTLDCQSTLSFIMKNAGGGETKGDGNDDNNRSLTETPLLSSSFTATQQPYSLKQTQHVFCDKQINVSFVLENLHCLLAADIIGNDDNDGQDGVDWHSVLQADSLPLTTALSLTPDCMVVHGVNIYCGIDSLQIFMLPLLRSFIGNPHFRPDTGVSSASSSAPQQAKHSTKKDINDQCKITKLKSIQGALEIGKLIIMCDTPDKTSFYSRLVLDDITFTTQSVPLEEIQSHDVNSTIGSIIYTLVDSSLPLNDNNSLNLLCTAELSVEGNLRLITDGDFGAYDGSVSQLMVTLNSPILTLDTVKQHLLESWIVQLHRFYVLKDPDTVRPSFIMDRLPSVDMSLVLVSPKVHFQHLLPQDDQLALDLQGLFHCTSVRWLLSGEYDSSIPSPSPSSAPLSTPMSSRRKRSTNLIQRLTIPSSSTPSSSTSSMNSGPIPGHARIYKMVFWLNIDNMRVDYWQHHQWIPWVASKHLDLAVKTYMKSPVTTVNRSISVDSTGTHSLENVIDLELQATMDKPEIHLCDSTLVLDPLIYWTRLLQPFVYILESQSSTTAKNEHASPPQLNLRNWLSLYSRCTASLSMLQTKIIMIGIDKKAPLDRTTPSGYLDNSPRHDMVARVQFSMEKLSMDSENRITATTTTTTTPPISNNIGAGRFLGNVRLSLQQLLLTQTTTIVENRYMDDGFDGGNDGDNGLVLAWVSRLHVTLGLGYLQNKSIPILVGVDIKLRKMGLQYSLGNHYSCLLVVNALRRVKILWTEKTRLDDDATMMHSQQQQQQREQLLLVDKIQCQIFRLDIHIFLPGQHELFFRADDLVLFWRLSSYSTGSTTAESNPLCSVTNVTLFGVSPDVKIGDGLVTDNGKQKWEALVELDDVEWLTDDISSRDGDVAKPSATLVMTKSFIRVPHGYVIAHVLENVVHLVKGVRELHCRIMEDTSDSSPYFAYVGPIARNSPMALPSVTLQCNQVILRLDDDPFEAKLRRIFHVGQSEQVKRLNLEAEFEKEKIRCREEQQLHQPVSASSANSNTKRSQQRQYFTPISYATNENDTTEAQISTAQKRLWEIYSESWIKNIQAHQQKETAANDQIRQADYRYRCVVEALDAAYDDSDTGVGAADGVDFADLFRLEIIPLPLHAPLAQLNMIKSIATINQKQGNSPSDDALFPLDETVHFVHNMGKGVPLCSDFSFLIPFHLNWQAGETSIQIRDYPLPLLHVPAAIPHGRTVHQHQQEYCFTTPAAWSLSGNYVIADDFGVKEGSRIITLNVDSNPGQNQHQQLHSLPSSAQYYNINVVRTASPTKFYSSVHYNIYTSAMSTICLSVSYQPAIQDILEILESITPAPVDPSAKIGVWDKIRLMIHTKTKVDFSIGGGDFAFVAKGTRDPYELMGLGAGMAKLWRGEVIWLLGYPNPQQEFTQIFSNSYVLGVPDLIRGGYVPSNLSSSITPTSTQPKILFSKIAIKLAGGVQMGIGCHLERTCTPGCLTCQYGSSPSQQPQCRFLCFKPHYQVVFKSKNHVGNDYHDAYAGFRSDFVHLSISIIKSPRTTTSDTNDASSTSGNGLNAMHLSPHFVNHFRRWYGLFGGPLSLPIRRGPLFNLLKGLLSPPAPPVKIGRHIQSLKYKIMIQPMAFGYFCMLDERRDSELDGGGVDAIGLKINVSHFCVDVHQRRKRQMTTLGFPHSTSSSPMTSSSDGQAEDELYRVKSNWPLHEVEIQLRDVDLRVVYTQNTPFSPNHPSYDNIDFSNHLNTCGNYTHQQWIDEDDYRELGLDMECSTIAASGKALPFAYSPCVDYVKRLDPIWVNRNRHLKSTHSCIMGSAKGALGTQLDYLHRRIETVEQQLRHHQQLLELTEMRLSKQSYNADLLQEANGIISVIARLNTRQHLLSRYIQKILHLSASDPIYNTSPSSRLQSSKPYSAYFDDNSLKHWEQMMGRFKERYTVHNPQIIWSPAVHDIVSRWRDARAHYNIQAYNISSRATQLLRELVELGIQQENQHKQNQQGGQHRSAYSSSTKNDKKNNNDMQNTQNVLDSKAAQDLLKKLLADRDCSFMVDNETKQHQNQSTTLDDKCDDKQHSSDGNKNDDAEDSDNNPRYQLDQIPDGCSSENMTLIDLWNPQLFLQSNTSQDYGILVANERVQVKQFEIIEAGNCDVDTCAVKKRTVASVEAVQLFVVKPGLMDGVDVSLDSNYGVHFPPTSDIDRQHQHILSPWIPPEMFTDNFISKYHTARFLRFGNDSNITGTIQYDRHNPIRSSSAYHSSHHYQPWDDQCNSTHLNFPNFVFTANPFQYSVLYQVIVDIILFKKEARHLERSDRLRDITFSIYASGDSPSKTLDDVIELQTKIRHFSQVHQDYQRQLICSPYTGDFDSDGLALLQQRCNSARQQLTTYKEALFLLMQSFKQIMDKYHHKDGSTTADEIFNDGSSLSSKTNSSNNQMVAVGKIKISVKSLVWKMLQDDGSPFSQWKLTNTSYVLITSKDQSLCHTIEIDKLVVKNTSSSPTYKQVVGPYLESSISSSMVPPDFSRHKMVYGRLVSLRPVGGIPVIQQLELNVFPLRLQLTYDFWRAFVVYLFPASPSLSTQKTSTSASSLNSMATASAAQSTSTGAIPTYDLKTPQNTSFHITDVNIQQSSSIASTTSAHIHPLESSPNSVRQDGSSTNSDTGIWFGAKRAMSTPTSSADTQTTTAPTSLPNAQQQSQKTTSTSKRKSWIINSTLPKLRKASRSTDGYPDDDDLTIMKHRASNNRTFILIKIHGAKHCLSFQGTKNIYDLQNFRFRQPNLEYRNKTWSWYDLLNALKKDFLRAVIKHSPALIKEKLKPSRLICDSSSKSYADDEELDVTNQQSQRLVLSTAPTHDDLSDSRSASLGSREVVELGIDGWFNDDSSAFDGDDGSSKDDLEVDDGGRSIHSTSSNILDVNDELEISTGIISEENDLISLHSNNTNNNYNSSMTEWNIPPSDLNIPIVSGKQRGHTDNEDGLFGKTISRLLPFSKKGKQRKTISPFIDEIDRSIGDNELERLQKGRLLFGKSYR
ncbi:golgi-body localization protein domain-domain-containing protein [Absidia repens]|uniref:Golgi-body localization protein domain-domain-containing protein n=1 Tax=Absidia repens TaxID=90262 RepID=A0A1X2I9G0_9FUNG|nr:golgi-body localization protein domain-domain-containing protein [Absidia repens]